MIKKIFIYWSQSFKKAPLVVNRCLLNWKLKNPNWQIVVLDDSSSMLTPGIVDPKDRYNRITRWQE